jgi:hypothetical protein
MRRRRGKRYRGVPRRIQRRLGRWTLKRKRGRKWVGMSVWSFRLKRRANQVAKQYRAAGDKVRVVRDKRGR